jgi:hypothetical protein
MSVQVRTCVHLGEQTCQQLAKPCPTAGFFNLLERTSEC